MLENNGSDSEDTKCLDFDPEIEFKKPHFKLKVGHRFTNFKVFREVLREWNVMEGYEVKLDPNESGRITGKCKKDCSWRIHASPRLGSTSFVIKSLKGEHTCAHEYSNKHATATYLSKKYQHKVRDDPKCSLTGLKNDIRRDLMVDMSIAKVYRAKRKAKLDMQGVDMAQ